MFKIETAKDIEIVVHDLSSNPDQYIQAKLPNFNIDLTVSLEQLIKSLDKIKSEIKSLIQILQLYQLVHTDKKMRDKASILVGNLIDYQEEKINLNQAIYLKFEQYKNSQEYEKLDLEYKYFFDQQLKSWTLSGLTLEQTKQDLLKDINQKISFNDYIFNNNILYDPRKINISEYRLQKVPNRYLKLLPKKNNLYLLRADSLIQETAKLEATRKKFWNMAVNIAYPQNQEILGLIIELSNQKAEILGYTSFAELDISSQMAGSPEQVYKFIKEIIQKSRAKIKIKEKSLILPWNIDYYINNYKIKNFGYNENILKEYFSVKHSLPEILNILSNLFGIEFVLEKNLDLWASNIYTYRVMQNSKIKGFIILDLFYRENKYENTLEMPIISSGYNFIGLSVITANYNSNLTKSETINIFHELGHALHTILGETALRSFAGTQTKRDFSEMPSQLLEQLFYEPVVLKQISFNYKTKESLSDKLIDQILASRKYEQNFEYLEQAFFSLISLEFYGPGAKKNLPQLYARIYKETFDYIEFSPEDHLYLSFDHLTAYYSKYYSYLWSLKIALDIFNYINKLGTIGYQKYIHEIVSKGGSLDPDILIKNFFDSINNITYEQI